MPRLVRLSSAVLALALLFNIPTPAHASKDTDEIKLQLRNIMDSLDRLKQANDERMGVMRDLVQQTTDSVNRMQGTIDTLSRQVKAQADDTGKKTDTMSGQVQALNDSLDELKARLNKIDKSLGDINSAQQSINARLASGPSGSGDPTAMPSTTPAPTQPTPAPITRGKPSAALGPAPAVPAAEPNASAPAVEDLYRTAYGDFNGGKTALATAEFNDIIHLYPDSNLAGNAYFYLGELDFKAFRYGPAARNYDKVLEQYPGNVKAPTAQLRKGESLIGLKQTDAGARELRSLVQRFPNSPEAVTAKAKLATLAHR